MTPKLSKCLKCTKRKLHGIILTGRSNDKMHFGSLKKLNGMKFVNQFCKLHLNDLSMTFG